MKPLQARGGATQVQPCRSSRRAATPRRVRKLILWFKPPAVQYLQPHQTKTHLHTERRNPSAQEAGAWAPTAALGWYTHLGTDPLICICAAFELWPPDG